MDDDEYIRDLAASMFKSLGYEVETCGGEVAVALYRHPVESGAPFFMVILDLNVITGMGGKEAAVEILRFDPMTKLVISSGYSEEAVLADSRDSISMQHFRNLTVFRNYPKYSPYRPGQIEGDCSGGSRRD